MGRDCERKLKLDCHYIVQSFTLGAVSEERTNTKVVFLSCEKDSVTVGGASVFVSNCLYC